MILPVEATDGTPRTSYHSSSSCCASCCAGLDAADLPAQPSHGSCQALHASSLTAATTKSHRTYASNKLSCRYFVLPLLAGPCRKALARKHLQESACRKALAGKCLQERPSCVTHPLAWMAECLHARLYGVHWIHGCVLCDASSSASQHVLQAAVQVHSAFSMHRQAVALR